MATGLLPGGRTGQRERGWSAGSAALSRCGASRTFQQVLEAIDVLDMIRCAREGLVQARKGAGMPSSQFFASLLSKRKRSRAGA